MEKGQAEHLMPMLEALLAETGHRWGDLACIGVGTGPGNFTGVRISVALARGLALGLGIPAVGVTTLQAQALGTDGTVISSVDARKGALYVQVFGPEGTAMICDVASLPEIAAGAAPACVGFACDHIAAHYAGRVAAPVFGLTEAIARIALQQGSHAPRPAPFYLRGADAAPPSDPPPVILP